ncbi:hypothetical protein [Priestia aryabhattai]|uniref:hypothetical protein n=1 Tax=Priestia aryabhattai TaxID=412384 RepID=UPI00064F28DA|nr:hypothetical protein [Priestia aryabhattai]KML28312.1 hypothetical protein VL11_16425 [Priestia aryabhattai]KMO01683.1 hypothetical protein ABV89_01420 [Priestia aryabhattai]
MNIMTLLVGSVVFIVFSNISFIMAENKGYSKIVHTSSLFIFFILVGIGFLQTTNQLLGVFSFIDKITGAITENVYTARVQLLSGEPSWATMHMLTFGFLFIGFYTKTKRKIFLVITIAISVIFFFSLSFYGYTVLFLSFFIFLIVSKKVKPVYIITFIVGAILIIALLPIIINSLGIDNYSSGRFLKLNNIHSIEDLLYIDGSFFVRIVFPIIGVLNFTDSPLFGVGGGQSFINLKEFITLYFDKGLIYPEVYNNVYINPEVFTPRNLFAKILGEEGLIGFLLYIFFLVRIYIKAKHNSTELFAFSLVLSIMMNFDSYMTIDIWLLLGMINGGYFSAKKE